MCIVAKFYGRMPFLSPTWTLTAVQELRRYVSIEGQGHFFSIYFPDFVCFVLYKAKISGERLQDHWSSGLFQSDKNSGCYGNL